VVSSFFGDILLRTFFIARQIYCLVWSIYFSLVFFLHTCRSYCLLCVLVALWTCPQPLLSRIEQWRWQGVHPVLVFSVLVLNLGVQDISSHLNEAKTSFNLSIHFHLFYHVKAALVQGMGRMRSGLASPCRHCICSCFFFVHFGIATGGRTPE